MKIKYIIPTVGDGGNQITSSLLLRIESKNKKIFRSLYERKINKKTGPRQKTKKIRSTGRDATNNQTFQNVQKVNGKI